MFIPINMFVKMLNLDDTHTPAMFRSFGFRVFSDDDGALYLAKNAAKLYMEQDKARVEHCVNYVPTNEHEHNVKDWLLSPFDYGTMPIVKEI